jgi:hypothetical protein
MMGNWTPVDEIDDRLSLKVGKMLGSVGEQGLKNLNKTRKTFREEIFQSLKTGRTYHLKCPTQQDQKPGQNQKLQAAQRLASKCSLNTALRAMLSPHQNTSGV